MVWRSISFVIEEKRRAYDETLRQPTVRLPPSSWTRHHHQPSHFSSVHSRLFSDFFSFEDIFGEFFHMRGRAPFPFQRAARPHPVSKQIICDLTTDENGRYYVQVHWSDGSITYERL